MLAKHSLSEWTAAKEYAAHNDYSWSLFEYSSRFLTYDSDVLNAFSGALEVICNRMSGGRNPELEHAYGLPTYVFDWALLWRPAWTSYRRSKRWPSWSWCGGFGTARMALLGMDDLSLDYWLSNRTWINWIIYDLNGQPLMRIPSASTYQRKNQTSTQLRHFDNQARTSPAPASKVQALMHFCSSFFFPEITNTCSPLLHFATVSLHLHLTVYSEVVHKWPIRTTYRSTSSNYMIHHNTVSRGSHECGYIELDDTWHYDSDPERTYEFLVLSEAPRRAVERDYTTKDYKTEEWGSFFVMLIERDPQNEEIAERVGLGAIYREAVDMAFEAESGRYSAEWKEVWLR